MRNRTATLRRSCGAAFTVVLVLMSFLHLLFSCTSSVGSGQAHAAGPHHAPAADHCHHHGQPEQAPPNAVPVPHRDEQVQPPHWPDASLDPLVTGPVASGAVERAHRRARPPIPGRTVLISLGVSRT